MWLRANDGTLVNMDFVHTVGAERCDASRDWIVVAYFTAERDGGAYSRAAVLRDELTHVEAEEYLTDVLARLRHSAIDVLPRARVNGAGAASTR